MAGDGDGPRPGLGPLADAKRVAVIGNVGAGKTTVARAIGRALGLPVQSVDRMLWDDDWQPVPAEAFETAHAELMLRERWVVEGFGPGWSIKERMRRADVTVFLDPPTWLCAWRGLRRGRTGDHTGRPAGMLKMLRALAAIRLRLVPRLRRAAQRQRPAGEPQVVWVRGRRAVNALLRDLRAMATETDTP